MARIKREKKRISIEDKKARRQRAKERRIGERLAQVAGQNIVIKDADETRVKQEVQ